MSMNAYEEIKKYVPTIKWAQIQFIEWDALVEDEDGGPVTKNVVLRSDHTEEDLNKFLCELKSINYDAGYGIVYLTGTIMLNDGSWLERREYDGAEWWAHCSVPQEPNA